jgi:hypothetical protein
MQIFKVILIALEVVMWLNLEMLASNIRWHKKHPKENQRIALQHERQDRLEGRY